MAGRRAGGGRRRRRGGRRAHPRRSARASRRRRPVPSACPGLTLPGFANAHSHAFHRALRGRTQRGTGSFWTWRRQMYEVAATLDPDALLPPRPGDVRRDGAGRHQRRRRVPLPPPRPGRPPLRRPERDGRRPRRRGRRGRPADHPARHVLPARRSRRRARPGAGAVLRRRRVERGRRGSTELRPAPGVRIGAAVHSVRAVDPADIAVVAAWARERARAAARPRVGAAGRERRRCWPPTAPRRSRCCAAPARSTVASPPCTPPT